MTTINVNGALNLDQTSGQQTGGDGDDLEIMLIDGKLEGLPDVFRDFLFTLSGAFLTTQGLDFADDAEAATTSGTDPFITVDPDNAEVGALFFSDSNGDLLDGDLVFLNDGVTAMTTVDGSNIYLHSYMDGAVVLATTSAIKDDGEVVAAFYLDTADDLLSAEVTMVTFIPIAHPITTDPDDTIDWTNILNVSATGSLSFDFDNLDSGNFLHVTVGTTEAGLLVSGLNPVIDPDGSINKQASDTINTSQGGAGATIGVNNQMFVPGNVAVFTLVEEATGNRFSKSIGQ